MTTRKAYDNLIRLTFERSTPASGVGSGAPPLLSFPYEYNDANQPIRSTLADGNCWRYEYESLGQVKRVGTSTGAIKRRWPASNSIPSCREIVKYV